MNAKIIGLCWTLGWAGLALAEEATEVRCGQVVEGEFRQNQETRTYRIRMQARERLRFRVAPAGEYLAFVGGLNDPAGNRIGGKDVPQRILKVSTGKLSAPGDYQVRFQNSRGIGRFTLTFSCTREDGSKIEAVAASPPGSVVQSSEAATLPPSLSAPCPLPKLKLGTSLDGVLPARGPDSFGFAFAAAAGAVVRLRGEHLAGNADLQLTLLAPDQRPLFNSPLTPSQPVSTPLTLPAAGDYTVRVARSGPRDAAEVDAEFRIKLTLTRSAAVKAEPPAAQGGT